MCCVEMQSESVMDIGKLVNVAETLENIVSRCFGPNAGQVLFVRATGDILITRDGCRILESLLLDHPAARLMVRSVSAHCRTTGDGAKSFILLLAAMLRGVRAATGGQGPGDGWGAQQRRRLARGLARLEREVLGRVLAWHLAPHCASALSPLGSGEPHLPVERAARVLGAYFAGKAGAAHAPFLTRLACHFLRRLGDGETGAGLGLADDCLAGLLATVPGLPVGSSLVLEGLPLGRGFTLRCPAGGGQTRVLVTTRSLLPSLTRAGCTLRLESPAGLAQARAWAWDRAEEALARLRGLGVGLLLSGPRQPACVLQSALGHGVSVVDCLPDQELALVSRLAGAQPVSRVAEARPTDTVPASFVRPAPLGHRGWVLVGFAACRGLRPHCLVLCAPALGLAEQHRDAVHGAFRLLRLLLPPEPGAMGSQWHGGSRQCPTGRGRASDTGRSTGDLCTGSEGLRTGDLGTGRSEGQGTGSLRTGSEGQGTGDLISAEDQTDGETGTGGEESQRHESEAAGRCGLVDPPAPRMVWDPSDCELPAGSVLPPGGVFEFLMHHYLRSEASSRHQPDTRVACQIVADALLNVPRHVHPRGRDFLRAHAAFTADLRAGAVPLVGEGPLEVVAAKQHLLISVIQCLRSLLTVDRVVAVRGKLGNKPPAESDDSE
uniref:Bardet-Biedl syndrome 10 protein n=1 Tax=Pristiophorus japonicus TaxID=55135 RepID=UPI00398F6ABA